MEMEWHSFPLKYYGNLVCKENVGKLKCFAYKYFRALLIVFQTISYKLEYVNCQVVDMENFPVRVVNKRLLALGSLPFCQRYRNEYFLAVTR